MGKLMHPLLLIILLASCGISKATVPNPNGKNFFEVLGLERSATQADFRRAARRIMVKCHPDRHSNLSKDDQAQIVRFFKFVLNINDLFENDEELNRYRTFLTEKANNNNSAQNHLALFQRWETLSKSRKQGKFAGFCYPGDANALLHSRVTNFPDLIFETLGVRHEHPKAPTGNTRPPPPTRNTGNPARAVETSPKVQPTSPNHSEPSKSAAPPFSRAAGNQNIDRDCSAKLNLISRIGMGGALTFAVGVAYLARPRNQTAAPKEIPSAETHSSEDTPPLKWDPPQEMRNSELGSGLQQSDGLKPTAPTVPTSRK